MTDGVPLNGTDVTANYRFNDGSGTTAIDSSIYNRPGTLSGGATFSTITNVPWTLRDSVTGSSIASGATSPISFTATDEGMATAEVLGNRFPVVIRNVAPKLIASANLGLANSGQGVREGQTISVDDPRVVGNTLEYDVRVNGTIVDKYVVSDPGTADRTNMRAQIYVTDPTGQATELRNKGSLSLNGRGYVDTGYRLSTVPSQRSSTFEAWVLPTPSGGSNRFVFDTAGSNGQGWALYRNAEVWFIDTGSSQFNTGRPVAFGQWQHLAVVFDTETNRAQLYINGVAAGASTPIATPAVVGGLNIGADFAGSSPFTGNVDEFRVWNRALTAAEVAKLDDGPVPVDAPNLAGWWSFNEGFGTVTKDRSVLANDARILSVITPVDATASTDGGASQSPTLTINGQD